MNSSGNQKQSSLPGSWLLYWISEKVVIGGQRSLTSSGWAGNPANISFSLPSDLQKFHFFIFFFFMQALS